MNDNAASVDLDERVAQWLHQEFRIMAGDAAATARAYDAAASKQAADSALARQLGEDAAFERALSERLRKLAAEVVGD